LQLKLVYAALLAL